MNSDKCEAFWPGYPNDPCVLKKGHRPLDGREPMHRSSSGGHWTESQMRDLMSKIMTKVFDS